MSTKGRAAIYVEPKKPLVVDEVEFGDPGPDQVLVKLFASGVCHSQLHTMQRPARKGQSLPALLGHESTGVVVAKGRDVRHVKEGDHVITTWVDRDSATTNQPMVMHALNDRAQYSANWKGKLSCTRRPLGPNMPSPRSGWFCRCRRSCRPMSRRLSAAP